VLGAAGMLGRDVAAAAGDDVRALSREELDVTDAAAVREALAGADVAINCAAYTDVDGAESEPERALRVNRDGARNVAEAATRVLYVSTDYVFDGTKHTPYTESDPTGPLQSYGRSKLAGERATAEANPRHFIVRSSWLFGRGGKNFVETMLGLEGRIRVVDDQVGCPTYTGHLAEALVGLVATEDYGVHHLAAAGSCSWFEFAREIFRHVRQAGVERDVEPCTTGEFPRPARRPAYSVLASERGHRLPSWREGLEAYLGVRV
jgi:dTDP-4-dehydrorhamnose reductase